MSQITPKLEVEVIQLLKQNKILEAIKLIVTNTELGLKDSKEYVDELKVRLKNSK
ncbi:hypothetical protein WAF17_07845 [Bernardetia sp. ABR2-2B]|uniref:hypothetical protein n=1 Tax=Bernardetia sp. ABR2-2B TaxID=3127472 RepID=UPI0030D588A7